jgi:hypothetical protein
VFLLLQSVSCGEKGLPLVKILSHSPSSSLSVKHRSDVAALDISRYYISDGGGFIIAYSLIINLLAPIVFYRKGGGSESRLWQVNSCAFFLQPMRGRQNREHRPIKIKERGILRRVPVIIFKISK